MQQSERKKRGPRSLSPTPLRDWVARKPVVLRCALVILGACLIAAGGKASAVLPWTAVPSTQQLFFVLLSGVLLGSRLGAVSVFLYLLAAVSTGRLWPDGFGADAMTGSCAGYVWSLPVAAYLSGVFVERGRSESAALFAIGVAAAVAAYDAMGTLRLMVAADLAPSDAFLEGSAYFLGQQCAQGALATLIGTSTSTLLHTRDDEG